jgi:IclR family acetate operon transcriptional repressor
MEALAESPSGRSLSDLAQRVELVKSSVFRILFTLKSLGYVEQTGEGGAYRLTLKAMGLARFTSERPTLVSTARRYLEAIRDKLHESAWLAEWRRGGVIIVDEAPVSHRLRLSLDVGDQCPLHASALGKAIAAYIPPKLLEEALGPGPLRRFTNRTITSRPRLAMELSKVRRQGYAVNEEESVEGAVLISAPIFDAEGAAFAAVSVSCPTARCTEHKRGEMALAVIEGGKAISRDLEILGFKAAFGPEIYD